MAADPRSSSDSPLLRLRSSSRARHDGLAAVPVSFDSGRGRRDDGRGAGLRGGHRPAFRSGQGAGMALGINQCGCGIWAGNRRARHSSGPVVARIHRCGALCDECVLRLALASRIPEGDGQPPAPERKPIWHAAWTVLRHPTRSVSRYVDLRHRNAGLHLAHRYPRTVPEGWSTASPRRPSASSSPIPGSSTS